MSRSGVAEVPEIASQPRTNLVCKAEDEPAVRLLVRIVTRLRKSIHLEPSGIKFGAGAQNPPIEGLQPPLGGIDVLSRRIR